MPGPLGKHEAVASRVQSGQDVVDNLLGADGVIDEVPVYGGDTSRCRRVSIPTVLKRRGVDIEDRFGGRSLRQSGRHRARRESNHGVADWAQLETNKVVELVTTVGGGGQSEPAAGRNLTHGMLERGGRHMVTLHGSVMTHITG